MRNYTLKEIQEESVSLEFKTKIKESGLPELEVEFTGSLESMDEAALLIGALSLSYETNCNVCSKQFNASEKKRLNIFLTTPLEEEENTERENSIKQERSKAGEEIFIDLDTDDVDCYTINKENIDIIEIIKEELILDLPMRFLCSTECRLKEEEEESIKPFSVLNDFLEKGEKNAES